jgi:hypothetical protein
MPGLIFFSFPRAMPIVIHKYDIPAVPYLALGGKYADMQTFQVFKTWKVWLATFRTDSALLGSKVTCGASSQAPAWKFGVGSSSFPSREARASSSRFPSWSLGVGVRGLSALFLLGLSGCALIQPEQVTAKPELMPMAQPLGPTRRIVQQINAVWADREESLLAVLELDARHIAMAGLSNDGLSLFNLTYDGKTVVSDKSPLLPESVNPEFIITDLQLVYWPLAMLQKNLPAEWRLEEVDKKRFLTIRNKKQVEINYLSSDPVWPKIVELVNFQYNYRLHIKTISYDLIPE